MILNEAQHPGMSNNVRGKLAKILVNDKKAIQSETNPKKKEYLKNLAKFNATNYNPEHGRQTQNESTPVAKKNKDAYIKNSSNPKENNMYKKNYMRMNLKEDSDFSFKARLLQENYPGIPGQSTTSGVEHHLKDNWKKYAGGAGLGALGMAASHVLGDSDVGEGHLDELKTASKDGQLWNTLLDKGQNAIGNLKTDDATSNQADFSVKSGSGSSTTDHMENKTGQAPWQPKFKTLNDISKAAADDKAAAAAATPEHTQAEIEMAAKAGSLPYAGEKEGTYSPFTGNERANHLFSWRNNPDASVTDTDVQDALANKVGSNYDKQWNTYQDTKQAQQEALDKFRSGTGDASAEDIKELKGAIAKTPTAPTMNANALTNVPRGLEDTVQTNLDSQLNDSINYAKANGFDFMLNGNTKDDLAAFAQMQAGRGIPEQLMPIYREVLRAANKG